MRAAASASFSSAPGTGLDSRSTNPGGCTMRRTLTFALGLTLLVPTLASAQRTSVSGDIPIYNNQGKPDLTPDPKRFVSQMEIVDRLFNPADSELVAGSLGAP